MDTTFLWFTYPMYVPVRAQAYAVPRAPTNIGAQRLASIKSTQSTAVVGVPEYTVVLEYRIHTLHFLPIAGEHQVDSLQNTAYSSTAAGTAEYRIPLTLHFLPYFDYSRSTQTPKLLLLSTILRQEENIF